LSFNTASNGGAFFNRSSSFVTPIFCKRCWIINGKESNVDLSNIHQVDTEAIAVIPNTDASIAKNLQVFNSVPGFSIRMQNLAKYRREAHSTFVHYAWTLSQEYVENISVSYVTAIRAETRDDIFDRIEALEYLDETQFKPEDWAKLCNVFDEAAQEVWRLVNQSWGRYVTSPNFEEFKMSGNTSDIMTEKMAEGDNNTEPGETVEQAIEMVHDRTTTQQDKLDTLVLNANNEPRDPHFDESS